MTLENSNYTQLMTLIRQANLSAVQMRHYFVAFIGCNQCDQIGRFLKVLCNNFTCKSSPKTFVTFWALLKSIPFCKNCCGIYLGNFWKHLGYIFTPISGHTFPESNLKASNALIKKVTFGLFSISWSSTLSPYSRVMILWFNICADDIEVKPLFGKSS